MSPALSREPLVDTNVWIDYLGGQPQAIEFVQHLPERVWISAVSVADLHPCVAEPSAGVREGAERHALAQLPSTLDVADLTATIAAHGGLLCRDHGRSHGIGLDEALIAATALQRQLPLFSLNVKHYRALEGLQVQKAYSKV